MFKLRLRIFDSTKRPVIFLKIHFQWQLQYFNWSKNIEIGFKVNLPLQSGCLKGISTYFKRIFCGPQYVSRTNPYPYISMTTTLLLTFQPKRTKSSLFRPLCQMRNWNGLLTTNLRNNVRLVTSDADLASFMIEGSECDRLNRQFQCLANFWSDQAPLEQTARQTQKCNLNSYF